MDTMTVASAIYCSEPQMVVKLTSLTTRIVRLFTYVPFSLKYHRQPI